MTGGPKPADRELSSESSFTSLPSGSGRLHRPLAPPACPAAPRADVPTPLQRSPEAGAAFRETLRDLFVVAGVGGWCLFSFCSSFASSLLGWRPFPDQTFRFRGARSAVRGLKAVCDGTRREPLRSALLGISGGSRAGALSSGRRAFSGFARRGGRGRGGQGTESRDLLGEGRTEAQVG